MVRVGLGFLELLKEDLEIENAERMTWITNKQKGLIEAIKNFFKGAEHRFGVRLMYNNFKTAHKGLLLKQTLWNATRATTKHR